MTTIDANNAAHSSKTGRFEETRTPEAVNARGFTPIVLDPAVAQLRKAANDAVKDADKAAADAVKEFAREYIPGAATLILFKTDGDHDGDPIYTLLEARSEDPKTKLSVPNNVKTQIENAIPYIEGENLYLLGDREWSDGETEDGFETDDTGYVLTIDLTDKPHVDKAALNMADLASDHGPLLSALQTVRDRGSVDDSVIEKLDWADIDDLYNRHIGDALDKIEKDLLDPNYPLRDKQLDR